MLKLILLLLAITLYGADTFGLVKKIKGTVLSNNKVLKINDKVYVGFSIITKNHAKVVIKQANGNIITIGKNSQLLLTALDEVNNKKGSSYFNIVHSVSKRFGKHKFKIKIKMATIGIRGTNFIVTSNKENMNVLLRKGTLDIIATKGKFKVFKNEYKDFIKNQKAQLDNYNKNISDEFSEYKRKDQEGFEKYTKSVKLKQNTMLVFGSKNDVYKVKMDKEQIKKEFDSFDNFNQDNISSSKIKTSKEEENDVLETDNSTDADDKWLED